MTEKIVRATASAGALASGPTADDSTPHPTRAAAATPLRVGGLFAGIGGIERGLADAGLVTAYLCEIDPSAAGVLRARFPGATLHDDVSKLQPTDCVDVLTAGFPCQDLSQAGQMAGIRGAKSSLVDEVFRVVKESPKAPRWVVLENVPFMLRLHRGDAAAHIVEQFEALGYTWAYRVVDARAFGLPQRRCRVFFVASKTEDPRTVLFADDAAERTFDGHDRYACGFYWTEGNTGVGWAVNAIPPLKGGSSIGIPSPPAIRRPKLHDFVLPDIRDAERLQGFVAGWSEPALEAGKRAVKGARWRLVGNAVSVPVARWIGERLLSPGTFDASISSPLPKSARWPDAAWGRRGERHAVAISKWPRRETYASLGGFLRYEPKPLPDGAAAGFYHRARASGLKFAPGFIEDLGAYIASSRTRR